MKARVLLLSVAMCGLVLAGCTTNTAPVHQSAPSASTPAVATTKVVEAPAAAPTPRVPTNLVDKTVSQAKAALTKAGFTHLVVAGGSGVTDASRVTAVTDTGKTVPPSTKIVITGAAPIAGTSTPSRHSRQACLSDETQCYMDGQQCAIGSCVNAARGLSQQNVTQQRDAWLATHPGYCASGVTGAVARCGDSHGATTGSDPNMRDANGETKAEYCARTGQSLSTCQAG